MSQRTPDKWVWTPSRILAAQLVAEDTLTFIAIAAKCGVERKSIERWKVYPEFVERVKSIHDALAESAYKVGAADKRTRVRQLDNLARKLQTVIEARAERAEQDLAKLSEVDAADKRVPPPREAATGLLVESRRAVGSGDMQEIVTEWRVDVGTTRELREVLKQIAIEKGEWDEAPSKEDGAGRCRILDGAAVVNVVVRAPEAQKKES